MRVAGIFIAGSGDQTNLTDIQRVFSKNTERYSYREYSLGNTESYRERIL